MELFPQFLTELTLGTKWYQLKIIFQFNYKIINLGWAI